jgi:hypothetical protein
VPSVDDHLFSHSAPGQQRADPVADLPGRAGADFADHPGALKTEHLTGTGRRWIKPGFL